HARIYETFIQQELGAPGDPDVRALAEELKTTTEAPIPTAPGPTSSPTPAIALADNMSTGEVVAVAMARLQRSRTITTDQAAAVLSAPSPQPPAATTATRPRWIRTFVLAAAALSAVAIGLFVRSRRADRPPLPTPAV